MSQRQGICGRLTKNTAGIAASVKRSAPSSIGGTPCRPTLITTKLTPHARTTTSASSRSFGDICTPDFCLSGKLGSLPERRQLHYLPCHREAPAPWQPLPHTLPVRAVE